MSGDKRYPMPPWGEQRIDEMTDAEKCEAMTADCSAYMAQAHAEEEPKARAWVEREVQRLMREKRRETWSRPWWTWPGAFLRGEL